MTTTDARTLPDLLTDAGSLALLVVDASPTFMPGGELPVPSGDTIIAPLVQLIREHGHTLGLLVFSRDWHPADHFSFSDEPRFQDGSWPPHGIAGTPNAQVHPDLIAVCEELGLPYIIISKGMDPDVEAYSAFDGVNLDTGRTLEQELRDRAITGLLLAGLAGEVCVQASAVSALGLGFAVALLTEGIGFLADAADAFQTMLAAGATVEHLPGTEAA